MSMARKQQVFDKQFSIVISKDSPDPSNFIFEINVGKKRIRNTTTLKLNDEFLMSIEDSNSESLYVRSVPLGGYFFKWRTVLYFFLETGKRYQPNSFFIVIYRRFVRG